MAKYQIMYWKEIPAQVKAMDDQEEFSFPLPPRFQEVIDEIAMREGDLDSDAYLDGWHWGEIQELPGTAEQVAQKVAADVDAQYPQHSDDLLDYIRNTRKNNRTP